MSDGIDWHPGRVNPFGVPSQSLQTLDRVGKGGASPRLDCSPGARRPGARRLPVIGANAPLFTTSGIGNSRRAADTVTVLPGLVLC